MPDLQRLILEAFYPLKRIAPMGQPVVTEAGSETKRNSTLPGWVVAVAIISAILMATGGLVALVRPEMLLPSGAQISSDVRVYAGYLVSRNLAIAALLLIALALSARRALATIMLLAALVQFVDSILDCFEGRWTLVPGTLVIGVALCLAATRVSGRFFWQRSFWSD